MARKRDQRMDDFETENTDGVLSGLLAEEEHLDRRAMFKLGTWGVASVGAVVLAVLANQSALKTRHDTVAALDLTRQSQQIQSVARESQNETRRLASAIDTLNGDRDRLYARLTSLEQGLDSVTGAIAKQHQAAAFPLTPSPAAPSPAAATAAMPQVPAPALPSVAPTTAPDPAPLVAPVTTTTTAMPAPEKPRVDAKKLAPPVNAAVATAPTTVTTPPNPPLAIEPEPLPAAAAPPPAPAAITSTPASEPDVAASTSDTGKVATVQPTLAAAIPLAVKRTQFAVDIGGANSVGGLRALWRGLLKSRSNAALSALQPIIVVKERDNGLGMQLRLVAGPLGDAAAAARICASLAANNRPCETTVFDGQRLSFNANDAPATTASISAKTTDGKLSDTNLPENKLSEKPSPEAAGSDDKSASSEKPDAAKPGSGKPSYRRGSAAAKRAAVEDPAKKPETATGVSSFFSGRTRSQ